MIRTLLLILLLIVVAAGAFVVWSYTRFDAEISADVDRLRAAAAEQKQTVTPEMLAVLPEPARRYLGYTGVVGKTIPTTVRLTQTGRIRSSTDAGWMTLDGEEIYSLEPPAFVWRAFLPSRLLPVVTGRDEYLGRRGSILMKAAALWPVADEAGDELAAAGLMRFLNEMMWFPAGFLTDAVTISQDGDNSFKVELSDGDITAGATIFVDADGRITNFRATRYNTATKRLETWETPISAYGTLGGMNLPTAGSAVWKLPEGDFAYVELEVTAVEYDPE